MKTAYVALGSNLDDPVKQVTVAIEKLANMAQSSLSAQSSLYRSKAIGPGTQRDYINAVVKLQTAFSAHRLLTELQAIEHEHGRVRTVRWEPRTLDLDILLYDDQVISTDRLSVPHPEMSKRNFVLYPLAEIAPLLVIPPDNRQIEELLKQCPDTDIIKVASDQPFVNVKDKNPW